MKSKNLKIIREACIAANPSILDVVFGCEVEGITDRLPQAKGTVVFVGEEKERYYVIASEEFGIFGNFFDGEFNVFGRPIRLADVLVAIGKATKEHIIFDAKFSELIELRGTTASGSAMGIVDIFAVTRVSWDLLADHLEDQSEETLAFLAELLK